MSMSLVKFGGRRYNRETLEVKYKDKNIADILEMTIEEAFKFLKMYLEFKKVTNIIRCRFSYLKLGQPFYTTFGGEAQRVKLSTELSKVNTGNTFYILDELTTGLHIADVHV